MRIAGRIASRAFALFLAGVAARASAGELPPPSGLKTTASPEEIGAALDRLVPRLLRDGDVPGLSLAIVRDGRVLLRRAYGVRDSGTAAPVNEDTVFEAASLSKPVFAYAVLKLADAGTLDLDAPLSKYLPGDYIEDPRQSAITARRVLSHTAGLPNWRPPGQPLKIHFAPGERFSYSGEGFVYLQKAVERVTGQTLGALMKRLVFDPLRMTSSSYLWEDRYENTKARGHDSAGVPRAVRRPAEAFSAASLHTTSLDYGRFLAAALDGAGLKKTTAAEMFRAQVRVDEGCSNCVAKPPTGRLSREIAWGLGWGLEETEDGVAAWHWGDNGGSGFHCFVAGFPRQRLGIVVFTNGLGGQGIFPEIVAAAIGGRHPSFAWLDYERYNSPARTWFKDILAGGSASIERGPAAALTEQQVNRVGYWLLGRKKSKEAIAVFERNVKDHPDSWNVHDSLGEAYAEDGQKDRAIASYQKSLALNPASTSGAEALRKLKTGS